jgi:hypothetical protein
MRGLGGTVWRLRAISQVSRCQGLTPTSVYLFFKDLTCAKLIGKAKL